MAARRVRGCGALWLLLLVTTAAQASPPPAAAPAAGTTDVKLHDAVVFRVLRGQGGKSSAERAGVAARALGGAVSTQHAPKVVVRGERHLVQVGDAVVIELDAEDAVAASDSTLQATSSRVRTQVRTALEDERKRAGLANTVFALSLVVFSALMSLFALRKIGEFAHRALTFVEQHPERIGALRLQSLELIGAAPLRAALPVVTLVLRIILQAAVIYVWLIVSLSQFEATKAYTHELTHFLVTPLLSLAGRLLSALPLGLVALFAGVVVYVLQRFVQLFFENVRRGHTVLPWVTPDLVPPVSAIARAAVVLLALVFVGPLVTGDPNGSLAQVGMVVMAVLGLAATPLLASAVVGVMQVLTRRVHVGQELSLAGRRGRVTEIGLFDLRLRDAAGDELRIPHLLSLVSPLRSHAPMGRLVVELAVSASARPSTVVALLSASAETLGERATVELRDIDAGGARFVITLLARAEVSESELRMALVEALADAGVALGTGAGSALGAASEHTGGSVS